MIITCVLACRQLGSCMWKTESGASVSSNRQICCAKLEITWATLIKVSLNALIIWSYMLSTEPWLGRLCNDLLGPYWSYCSFMVWNSNPTCGGDGAVVSTFTSQQEVWGSNLGSGLFEWSLQEENSTDSVMWNRIETLVNLLTISYLIIILPCQSPMYVLYDIV